MNRDIIERLARESGLIGPGQCFYGDRLDRFVALVEAHERERCAKVCDRRASHWDRCAETALAVEAEMCAEDIRLGA